MTITKTKAELGTILGLTPSQIKKATLADLWAQAQLTEGNAFGDDPDLPPATDPIAFVMPGRLDDSEYFTPTRKPQADGILYQPLAEQKEPRPGSKRALLIDRLRAGATIQDLCDSLGWTKATVSSALSVDVHKGCGYGVERISGRLFLLPREAK